MTFQEKLVSIGACHPSTEWVGRKSFRKAWDTCPRNDWMTWLLTRVHRLQPPNLEERRFYGLGMAVMPIVDSQKYKEVRRAVLNWAAGKGPIERPEIGPDFWSECQEGVLRTKQRDWSIGSFKSYFYDLRSNNGFLSVTRLITGSLLSPAKFNKAIHRYFPTAYMQKVVSGATI